MRKHSISVVFLLLFVSSQYSQQGWFYVASPGPVDIYSICFVDEFTGFAGQFKSTNGGFNWTEVLPDGGYDKIFLNSSTGFSISSISVYKTTNTGVNWTEYSTGTNRVFFGGSFANLNTGWIVGEFAEIRKSTNGGVNWVFQPNGVSTNYSFHGVQFVDENTGFVCGFEQSDFASVILKTTNGGISWTRQDFGSNSTLSGVYFLNSATGYVTGRDIRKSTDGGATWQVKPPPAPGAYGPVQFTSQLTGYAISSSKLIKTINGGDTWFLQDLLNPYIYEDMYFINNLTGFIAGLDGKIMKTTDGGGLPFGIIQISAELPDGFILEQNYPNPFNPATNIKFGIPKKTFVKITIYDILGKVVDELVNMELNPGRYSVDWPAFRNASMYPSAVYFYRIITDEYTDTKKMILVK